MSRKCFNIIGFIIGSFIVLIIRIILLPYYYIRDALRLICRKKYYKAIKKYVDRMKNKKYINIL